ncbi:hypothetical protein IQ235_09665, partial [Oscillatoriales cyanobacterium LEGE 11467]|nr:hypothetical protein [Zarconia navalis LEGE 11467]
MDKDRLWWQLMASVSPSSTSGSSEVCPPSLKAGLAALKQGRTKIAIAHLEGIVGQSPRQAEVLQAQMGLAIAYDKIGDTARATSTCEDLQASDNPKVRHWATKTLASWAKRSSQSAPRSPAKPTGFVPLDEEPPASPAPKPTGFVPLDEEPPSPPAPKPTGFVPLDEEPPSPPAPKKFVPSKDKFHRDRSPRENFPASPIPAIDLEKAKAPQSPEPTTTESEDSDSISPSILKDSPPSYQWRNRGRAKNWKRLKTPPISRLYAMQGVSAIALIGLASLLLRGFMHVTNEILVGLPFTRPIQAFYYDRTSMLVGVLLLVAIASPWLLDSILRVGFGLKPLTTSKLNRYSPEAYKSLGRVCRQKNLPFPTLGILPDATPAILTYGNWPKT